MAKVMKAKVYNVHSHGMTHREKFRDELIEIKAGEYVEMDYEDAIQFKSAFFHMTMDGSGVQKPESYKMLKIVPFEIDTNDKSGPPPEFVCQMDGKKFSSEAELKAYTLGKYGGETFSDESLESREDKPKKKKIG